MKISETSKTSWILFLFVLFLALPNMASASETDASVLSVTGEGSAQGTPDQATLTISVTNHARDAKAAQRENAASATKIQNALKSMGIDGKDIQTRNYSFCPTYREDSGHEDEINGYEASNSILVTIHDLNIIGQAIDTALSHGANHIEGLEFSRRDTEEMRREALAAAIRNARSKADIIAQELGMHIAGIKNVSESTSSARQRSYNLAEMAKSGGIDSSTPIEIGTLTLEASVHIDFILK
ncbi:MAG: SIMPL domain-containing protein [Selenomonadaceae bacterium]|nr:SIMPL domain-containing protein [Selenomonadaceae bacterium]